MTCDRIRSTSMCGRGECVRVPAQTDGHVIAQPGQVQTTAAPIDAFVISLSARSADPRRAVSSILLCCFNRWIFFLFTFFDQETAAPAREQVATIFIKKMYKKNHTRGITRAGATRRCVNGDDDPGEEGRRRETRAGAV